MTQTITLISF